MLAYYTDYSDLFLLQDVDIRQVACQAVQVQAIAQNELAGNLKSHILWTLAHGERTRLEEQGHHLHRLGIVLGQ